MRSITPLRRARAVMTTIVLALALALTSLGSAVPAGATRLDDPTTTVTEPPTTTTTTTTTPPAPEPAPPTGFTMRGPSLKVGDRGVEVVWLQVQLLNRGFWMKEQLGVYGQSTKHAVTAFQKAYRLARTGKVDGWTRVALAMTDQRPAPHVVRPGLAIEIDLSRQVLILSFAGRTALVLDTSTGKRSTPTPRGAFRIQRQINAMRHSSLGTLWRPKYFTGGYALHGSPSVPSFAASHGCVRLTNQEIDLLWSSGLAPVGTPVVLY